MRAVERNESQRGTVTWKVRFRWAGKQSSQTFPERREALRFAKLLDAMEGNAQAALDQMFEESKLEAVPTLDEVAADHIRYLTGVTRGTRLKYERLWERTWSPLIGSTRAHMVSRDDLAVAVNALGERYSTKSLENQRGLLAGVLNRAVDKGWLAKNPAAGMRLPRGREGERAEMRILTPAEFDAVLHAMPAHARPLAQFLIGTGARWGEAVALQVQDWQDPNVRIRRALKWSPDNKREVGPTKTRKSNRTITVGSVVGRVLDEQCAGKAKADLVFTAPRGGAVLHRTWWSRVWLPAVSTLEPRPRIHDLRHSAASWALANGVPIHVVSARLGHESIKTTVDTYGHLLPDAQLLAAQAAEVGLLGTRVLGVSGLPE